MEERTNPKGNHIDYAAYGKKDKPKFYQCGKCGRFVNVIRAGAYMDDFGYWVQYECKKCGVRED